MFNWYDKNAPKNTITRYLSTKYTPEELAQLTHLELPEQFESLDYSNELAKILKDSPWKVGEVKYKTPPGPGRGTGPPPGSSLKSLKGIFTRDWWFGKKPQPDWKNIDREFTAELTNEWTQQGFTYQQTQEWINIGLTPQEANLATWLSNTKYLTAEDVLNYEDITELRKEFSLADYIDSNPYANLAEDNASETTSIFSSENEETELKGTYRYEFITDNQALIIGWRTPSSEWRRGESNFYSTEYFAPDVAKYANSWLQVRTLAPLPFRRDWEVLRDTVLFSPCLSEKTFYAQEEENWKNCWVWKQEPLKYCSGCYQPLLMCDDCSDKEEPQPTPSFCEKNKELLIVASSLALIIILWKS